MLGKTYAAFKAAGVGDVEAQAAAEELAAFEARFASSIESNISHMDGKITAIKGKITVLLWAVGTNAAATIAILGVLLHHG